MNKEGWTWFVNSIKWHYLRDGRSLCKKWLNVGNPQLEQGNDDSIDNCAACCKRIEKEKHKKYKRR